ncbi:MAG: enoyl-CoA hydratase/carnithine racemase [Actinomycetia bacterium]|nr:enoyl-CoA hydratase/carnithine racemase [Actinomycetes bacterium]
MILERERRGKIEILTLNRPESRNAMTPELSELLADTWEELETDTDVWAVILTGAGTVFCAGADLKVVASGDSAGIASKRGGFGGLVERDFPKPLIAACNGPALAGGFEMVLACDMVVASTAATFGIPEAKRGLLAAAGGPIRLAKRIPLAIALEMGMTGDPVDARRAFDLGLVNRVAEPDAVIDTAIALAERIVENSPVSVRITKRLTKESQQVTESEGWALTNAIAGELFASGDAMEGAMAFLEKRPPVWKSV